MNDGQTFLTTAGVVLGDVAALVALRPDTGRLSADVTAPHAWLAAVGADRAAVTFAGAALWCVAVWLGTGLLAAGSAAVPGGIGRGAQRLARVLLPAALYRVLAGAAGLGMLLAPVAAAAAAPAAAPRPVCGAVASPAGRPVPATPTPPIPAPTWPTNPPRRGPAVPAPRWPTSPATPVPPAQSVPVQHRPQAPTATSSRAAPAPPRQRESSPSGGIAVRPGDSLWSIAAARLGPRATPAQIAATWPTWYGANRSAIGADPDLIMPGQVLQAPPSTQVAR